MIKAKKQVYCELFEKCQSLIEENQPLEDRVELRKDLFRLEKEYRDSMASILCYRLNLQNSHLNECVYYLSAGIYHAPNNSVIKVWS